MCHWQFKYKLNDQKIIFLTIQFSISHWFAHGLNSKTYLFHLWIGGARGVVVIVVGNGHGDTSSNPRRD